jgi:hypothetical protein
MIRPLTVGSFYSSSRVGIPAPDLPDPEKGIEYDDTLPAPNHRCTSTKIDRDRLNTVILLQPLDLLHNIGTKVTINLSSLQNNL